MSATVIGATARVLGSVEVRGEDGDLIVEGIVEGDVRASGRLTLGRHAQVHGTISARDVRIACRLDRDVAATGVIHLTPTAEVRGDLDAARVVIDDGAIFEGQVRLQRETRAARPVAEAVATRVAPVAAPVATPVTPRTERREVPTLAYPGRRRVQRRST